MSEINLNPLLDMLAKERRRGDSLDSFDAQIQQALKHGKMTAPHPSITRCKWCGTSHNRNSAKCINCGAPK